MDRIFQEQKDEEERRHRMTMEQEAHRRADSAEAAAKELKELNRKLDQ